MKSGRSFYTSGVSQRVYEKSGRPYNSCMKRKTYPSDLTNWQWKRPRGLLPAAKPGGRPRSVDLREVVNGILYVVRGGCAWRMTPHDLPPLEHLLRRLPQVA